MYKLLAAAVYLTLSAQAALGSLGAGQTCVTIAGPTKEKCARGLNCCFVANDYSVCHRGDCPSQYIPEGGLCDGFAGPVPGECNQTSPAYIT
ncbi:hypothetical protein NP233_g4598 [Leucocoprinus birnbaumii]|uniref:Uncharacterized protein n=1 Tax=Leucocoprinus birnbaumii TaxID=56174 RepID=A0AAD5VUF3_9AGAR|nr:hypothetical protein NP233_g4598 [Leucocoprinus birnbaumii]